jgi:hypothetical protein
MDTEKVSTITRRFTIDVVDSETSVTRKTKVALVRSASSASQKALNQLVIGFITSLHLNLCYMNDNGRIRLRD